MPLAAGGRVIVGIFGFVFFGAGLSILGFLWSRPFGGFGSPPLFFRVFGSLIALGVGSMGGLMLYGAAFGANLPPNLSRPSRADGQAPRQGAYTCPHCGAGIDSGADVSPSGDVKCEYCGGWFNVHR
jgi:hypothetical protein